MKKIIVVTGASSGFGRMAGHTVYAGIRETTGRNTQQIVALAEFAAREKVNLRTIEFVSLD
ncbi:hypothetical protein [Desulfobacter curvatus]|uniref:hypothetical protein n=1 Tax=Desulfobacter curvatus TaxID=2290 RepID=UPI00036AD9B4|nr:hypothetical protein [Desulfobacter curvatus]